LLLSDGKVINHIELAQLENISNANIPNEFKIQPLKDIEKEYILKVVKMCNGRISGANGAAAKLQLPSTTLISKMQKLGIKKEHFHGNSDPKS
jgi:formate hydrogenlyase transcriptional activator